MSVLKKFTEKIGVSSTLFFGLNIMQNVVSYIWHML